MYGKNMIRDLILKNRSYRRFHQEIEVKTDILKELVDLARLSGSGANLQPLKYILSYDYNKNLLIFKHLAWAGYLTDWSGPEEGERPSAYIIILGDTNIRKEHYCDHGIAAQSILLGAVEKGFGGCMVGSINKEKLRSDLNIPDHLEILLVLALGRPKEKVIIEDAKDGDIKYYRDKNDVHHVPKRPLDEIIL
jgi:nitroreductase